MCPQDVPLITRRQRPSNVSKMVKNFKDMLQMARIYLKNIKDNTEKKSIKCFKYLNIGHRIKLYLLLDTWHQTNHKTLKHNNIKLWKQEKNHFKKTIQEILLQFIKLYWLPTAFSMFKNYNYNLKGPTLI